MSPADPGTDDNDATLRAERFAHFNTRCEEKGAVPVCCIAGRGKGAWYEDMIVLCAELPPGEMARLLRDMANELEKDAGEAK